MVETVRIYTSIIIITIATKNKIPTINIHIDTSFTWKTQTKEKPPMMIFMTLAKTGQMRNPRSPPCHFTMEPQKSLYRLLYMYLPAYKTMGHKTMCQDLNHLLIPEIRLF